MRKYYFKLVLILITLQIIQSSCLYPLTDDEKMKIFYKNDWMFFYGDKSELNTGLIAEEGSEDELFSFSEISEAYRPEIKLYLKKIENFINLNMSALQEYYRYVMDPKLDDKQFKNLDKQLAENIKNNLLPQLRNGIRCMVAVRAYQYIEVAKKIGENKFAITMSFPGQLDSTFWIAYILPNVQKTKIPREQVLDDQCVIKYREWFYESNMKIRVVKQIRDEKGNYYGEIYADYYKLDQYDKLFDDKGVPRKLNKKK